MDTEQYEIELVRLPSALQQSVKCGLVRGHEVLQIRSGFIEKVL